MMLYLIGIVSIYALEIIFKEFEQIKFLEICGCQLHDDVDVEGQTSNTQLKKQSRSSKFSWVWKLKDIFSPSTTSLREPTSHKNKVPSGRPRLSTQTRSTVLPTQDPTTHFARRHSFATSMSDYNGSNQFDLNQEPERYNTFSFQQRSTFYLKMNFIHTLQTLKMWREMEIVDFGQ
uniref:Uncharacterized protein n=1 Tax=Lactuca sativa TaxID=4236 RepID=A0A9R1WYK5_LACSA|nr:hypothetical protein LSAT_V11C800389150 [Lactuca sativa]